MDPRPDATSLDQGFCIVCYPIRYPHPVPIPGHDHVFQYQHAAGFQHFGIMHFVFVGNNGIIPQRHLKSIIATTNIEFLYTFGIVKGFN